MVGGKPEVFERVKPVFGLMGKNITLVGGSGDGQTTKVANQIIVALNIQAVAEAPAVRCSKAGADPAQVRQALMGALLATSRILEVPGRAHDQAQLRPGLPHRAAPEGPEPGAGRGQGSWPGAARDRQRAAAVQCLRVAWRRGLGPFRHGARAGEAVELRDRPGRPSCAAWS
jgi:hypothetical protein